MIGLAAHSVMAAHGGVAVVAMVRDHNAKVSGIGSLPRVWHWNQPFGRFWNTALSVSPIGRLT
jgi:hypothetical protein